MKNKYEIGQNVKLKCGLRCPLCNGKHVVPLRFPNMNYTLSCPYCNENGVLRESKDIIIYKITEVKIYEECVVYHLKDIYGNKIEHEVNENQIDCVMLKLNGEFYSADRINKEYTDF